MKFPQFPAGFKLTAEDCKKIDTIAQKRLKEIQPQLDVLDTCGKISAEDLLITFNC